PPDRVRDASELTIGDERKAFLSFRAALSALTNLSDAEPGGGPTRARFAPRNQLGHVSTRRFQNLGARRLGRPALKGRLRRIGDVELDALCGGDAARFRREPKGAVNSRRDAGCEDPVAIDHNALVHRYRAEPGQEVERRPMRGRPFSPEGG